MVDPGPVTLQIDENSARFHLGECVVGVYVLDDPYKPYLHPLRTVEGCVASLAMPFDHRHHKGLMYALATTDVNWWEEIGSTDYVPTIGVQAQESLDQPAPGTLRQRLRWTAQDGTLPTFLEERTITCAWDARGFVRWTWDGAFTVLRDVTLRHSPAAKPDRAGTPINYHGLGLRFPRTFGWDGSAGTWAGDGIARSADEIIGTRPASITVSDFVDGRYPPHRVSVRIMQSPPEHAVFAMSKPFSYVSVGPSVARPVALRDGESFHEHYLIDVTDGEFDRR